MNRDDQLRRLGAARDHLALIRKWEDEAMAVVARLESELDAMDGVTPAVTGAPGWDGRAAFPVSNIVQFPGAVDDAPIVLCRRPPSAPAPGSLPEDLAS